MVKRVSVDLVDDLDGTVIDPQGGRTFTFRVEQVHYEMDLTQANIDRFHEAIGDYIAAARVLSSVEAEKPARSPRRRKSTTELAAVRDWARANGFEISSHGRVPVSIREAYAEAH